YQESAKICCELTDVPTGIIGSIAHFARIHCHDIRRRGRFSNCGRRGYTVGLAVRLRPSHRGEASVKIPRNAAILVISSAFGFFSVVDSVHAAVNRIEPDDYAEDAVLNDVHPLVDLRIYDGVIETNFPVDFGVFPDPTVITVTANENE